MANRKETRSLMWFNGPIMKGTYMEIRDLPKLSNELRANDVCEIYHSLLWFMKSSK